MNTVSYAKSGRTVPVGKILCLGRNYREHAKEMKAEVPETPIVFMKPATAIVHSGARIGIPPISNEMHHEVELVVLVGRSGKAIPKKSAFDYVGGYGIGIDFTLRDIQAAAKAKGLPWTVAKGFDGSAPVSEFVPSTSIADPHDLMIALAVNNEVRQRESTREMLFRIDELIEYVSGIFTLEEGDLLFTGTPRGVGPVASGDLLEARLEGHVSLRIEIR